MDEQKRCQTEYLTVDELSKRIKFSKQSIYNLVSKGVFVIQHHYLKPRPKKILFKWPAVLEWMENASPKANSKAQSLKDDGNKEKNLINI